MKRYVVIVVSVTMLLISGCGGVGDAGSSEGVELRILVRNATPPVEESFVVGDTVRVRGSGTELGVITDVYVEPARSAVPDSDGVLREAESPLLVNVILTVEGEAVVTESGIRFGTEYVYVNNDIGYLTPLVHFSGIIVEMQTIDPS